MPIHDSRAVPPASQPASEGAGTPDRDAATRVDLVRRIQAGDLAAEAEMVERYSRGILFMLRRFTGDEARAEDLHQETFRLALEKVRGGELREPGKLSVFLHGIARNLSIADYRQSSRHPTLADGEVIEASPDGGPSPLRHLLAKENADIVRRLLAELEPERDRAILLEFLVAERPKAEICAELGLTSLHFNRVLHRARQRLRDLVRRYHKRHRLPIRLGTDVDA
ncbi:MAG: sigma-70 family RNA polymerase sigma factor, partial [Holophagales bacterium]|nr:sigma-70 family RNA polymerase sigma factor [Holophagales bacterium]